LRFGNQLGADFNLNMDVEISENIESTDQ